MLINSLTSRKRLVGWGERTREMMLDYRLYELVPFL